MTHSANRISFFGTTNTSAYTNQQKTTTKYDAQYILSQRKTYPTKTTLKTPESNKHSSCCSPATTLEKKWEKKEKNSKQLEQTTKQPQKQPALRFVPKLARKVPPWAM